MCIYIYIYSVALETENNMFDSNASGSNNRSLSVALEKENIIFLTNIDNHNTNSNNNNNYSNTCDARRSGVRENGKLNFRNGVSAKMAKRKVGDIIKHVQNGRNVKTEAFKIVKRQNVKAETFKTAERQNTQKQPKRTQQPSYVSFRFTVSPFHLFRPSPFCPPLCPPFLSFSSSAHCFPLLSSASLLCRLKDEAQAKKSKGKGKGKDKGKTGKGKGKNNKGCKHGRATVLILYFNVLYYII